MMYVLIEKINSQQDQFKAYGNNNCSDNYMNMLLLSYAEDQNYLTQRMFLNFSLFKNTNAHSMMYKFLYRLFLFIYRIY